MLQILARFFDDWDEWYINGKLISEGDYTDDTDWRTPVSEFIRELATVIDLEFRSIEVAYTDAGVEDAPMACMTGQNYWSDWDKATVEIVSTPEEFQESVQ